jgi:DNA-repair protein XRCC3
LLSLGCPFLDRCSGGILQGEIFEISGESGSGKTQLCLQCSLTVQLKEEMGGMEGDAIYIVTENDFPNEVFYFYFYFKSYLIFS